MTRAKPPRIRYNERKGSALATGAYALVRVPEQVAETVTSDGGRPAQKQALDDMVFDQRDHRPSRRSRCDLDR
jgi:hypothetical protein